MSWETLLDIRVPGVGAVWVYDKGAHDLLGRYVISKHMTLFFQGVPIGFRSTMSHRRQRPAAIRYAVRWLNSRLKKQGLPLIEEPKGGAK